MLSTTNHDQPRPTTTNHESPMHKLLGHAVAVTMQPNRAPARFATVATVVVFEAQITNTARGKNERE
jgi:hypothetical protein